MPTTPTVRSELMTAEEIAEVLKIHVNSLYRWLGQGLFPAPIRLGRGGRWHRWRRSVFEKFLAEREGEHAPAKC
jgi:predicted DNA-binding transcriptional regulator AlpA